MGIFDDLISQANKGGPLSKLSPLTGSNALKVPERITPPADFVEFLTEIGAGEFGDGSYMLYDGLIEASEIYGDLPVGFDDIYLFGDDFQGYCTGYTTSDWSVIEIDSSNMTIECVARDFQEFIRSKLST